MQEFNPNNDQKLRLYIMEQFSSEDWQPAYDFLKAGENADNSPQVINFDESSMPDGVYVCYKDGAKQLFDGKNPTANVSHIGIIAGGRSLGIALSSYGEQKLPYKRDYNDDPDWTYRKGSIPALDDFNGKENTRHLIQHDDFSFDLEANEWIPSMGELALIWRNRERINEALKHVGGEPFISDWYWSSTEYSATGAWYLNFSNGTLNNGGKFITYVVRAVCAF
jgi:hypothetical protein